MSGVRLVLFGINSDAGLGAMPPLSFFTGGATVFSPNPFPEFHQAKAALAREYLEKEPA